MPEAFDPYRKWLGIPPKDQPPNHYRLLAIETFEDDPDVIEAAADARMAHVRTYQTGQNSAVSQRILNELAQARLCLLDPAKKGAYDAELRSRQAASSGIGGPASGVGTKTSSPASSRSLPTARPLPVAAESPVPLVRTDSTPTTARRRANRPAWLMPAMMAAGVALLAVGVFAVVRLTGGPTKARRPVVAGRNDAPGNSSDRRSSSTKAKKASRASDSAAFRNSLSLAADRDHPPKPPGVLADRIVIWNQHNGGHHDRGTRQCDLSLLDEGREIWRRDAIALPWSADRDENVSIDIPKLRFDRVRVEVTQWEQSGGGLAEIEVYRGDTNLARGCPATAGAQFDSHYPADKLTDGVTTSYFDCFWLLPDRMPGWAEIDLSYAEPRRCSGVQAEKLVLWNTHNSRHNDRGASALNVRLSLGEKEVWRQDDVSMRWQPDEDTSLEVALPEIRFDRVRIEVTRFPALGAGLSEVEVLSGGDNIARACPVVGSGCLNHNFRPQNVVDGITSSLAEEVGYWCAPDRSNGWIEVDLSCNCPEIGAANRELGAYRALIERDWPRALHWFARSNSLELRKLARLDASHPSDAHQQSSIGDGWWDAAEASSDAAKAALRARAAFRYSQAVPRLSEAERERPQERIAESLPLEVGTYLFLLHEIELKGISYIREPIVLLQGVPRPWALWMHPFTNQPTEAAFALDKRYRRLAGAAAINDTAQQGAQTPLTFRIVGDGRTIWTSHPLQQTGSLEPFDVDVSGVNRLELTVDCPGTNAFCHAVWIDPILDPTSQWPGIKAEAPSQQLATTSPQAATSPSSSPSLSPSSPAVTAPPAPETIPPTETHGDKPPSLADLIPTETEPSETRLPPPDGPTRKAAEQTLKQTYKAEWLGKGTSGRLGAARVLAAAAAKDGVEPAEQFVLLSQASELAAAAGNYREAAGFIDQLAERFRISPIEMRVEALTHINRVQKLPAQKQALTDDALFLAADAIADDDYESAERAAKLAGLASRGSGDNERAEAARLCLKDVAELGRRYAALRASLDRLAETPDDAAANSQVGQFECLVKHDWQRGLPQLARGNDEPLRELAAQDLLNPAEPVARLKLAEGWLERGRELKDELRLGCQLHALEWLELGRPGCRGGDREWADEEIAAIRSAPAYRSRPFRWLERLRLGVEVDDEIDCVDAARSFELGKTFDIGKSWVLTLEFLARDIRSRGQAFFIGDDRGGRDPLFVGLLDDGRLYVGLDDSHESDRRYELTCPLQESDKQRWKHVRVVYRDTDHSVVVDLDGRPAVSGVMNFAPAIDRPMLCWIGGVNAADQRFSGKVRRVLLTN